MATVTATDQTVATRATTSPASATSATPGNLLAPGITSMEWTTRGLRRMSLVPRWN